MFAYMNICEKADISNLYKTTFRKPHYTDLGINVFVHFRRFMQHINRGMKF